MNILSPPPTLDALEKLREQADSQFLLGFFLLAAFVLLACNGVFGLYASYDFGQPRWLSWLALAGGLSGVPFLALRMLKITQTIAGFEWVGADTAQIVLETSRNTHVNAYCKAVAAQGRMLTTREVYMLLERFSDREAIDKVMCSLPRRSFVEWLFSRYL